MMELDRGGLSMQIGKKIEDTMNFMMEISNYVAEQNGQIEKLNQALSMYSTLFDVNKYMNKNLEMSSLLPIVEDAMKATVGVNQAAVLISNHETTCEINDVTLTFDMIASLNIEDYLCIEDLKQYSSVPLSEGSLFIQKLDLINGFSGYLVGYWHVSNAVDENKLDFLKILGVQTALSVKSSLLMEHLTKMVEEKS